MTVTEQARALVEALRLGELLDHYREVCADIEKIDEMPASARHDYVSLDEQRTTHAIDIASALVEACAWEDEDNTCAADGCRNSLNDGEGWDGYCGTHADQRDNGG